MLNEMMTYAIVVAIKGISLICNLQEYEFSNQNIKQKLSKIILFKMFLKVK